MACAFGMEACKQYYNTKYIRLPDLLIDLEVARTDGNYKKVMAKYANPVVLILDEWLLLKPTESEQRDIFELLHRRRKNLQRFFAPSMSSRNGTTNWVVMIVLWQMQSLTALLMTVIVSTLQALMPNMISRCERFMAWTKHYVSKLA